MFQLNSLRSYDGTNLICKNSKNLIPNSDKFERIVFIYTQLLNELSQKVPVTHILKIFQFAWKPEQPGLSNSIRLEVMYMRAQLLQCYNNYHHHHNLPIPNTLITSKIMLVLLPDHFHRIPWAFAIKKMYFDIFKPYYRFFKLCIA